MKKFHVTASNTVYCYASINAKDENEAYEIANHMDGGDFEMEEDCGLSDWQQLLDTGEVKSGSELPNWRDWIRARSMSCCA